MTDTAPSAPAAPGPPGPTPAERGDDWPRTRRLTPWGIAAFLVMIWLIPFDSIAVDVPFPVDPELDRFALVALALVWFVSRATARTPERRREPAAFKLALGAFVLVALVSVLVNLDRITAMSELALAEKRLAQLIAYAVFAWVVLTTLRPTELRSFCKLLIVLACLTAVGTIYERHSDYNVFYDTARSLFGPVAHVQQAPTDAFPDPTKFPRATIVGPTHHGLAVTTMLAIALPFAVVGFFAEARRSRRVLYALAAGLILAGALTTERKTGALAPIVALLVVAAYRPREALRYLPVLVVLAAFIHVVSPGALGTVRQFDNLFGSTSTEGRTSDYPALAPDALKRPLLGRGFGTLDPDQPDYYRILDNEYLGELFQVGFVGLAAFIALILTGVMTAHPVIRSRDPVRAPPALAAAAGCFTFGVASALFDILSFAQAPYMFFFAAALCTVAGTRTAQLRTQPAPVRSTRLVVDPGPGA